MARADPGSRASAVRSGSGLRGTKEQSSSHFAYAFGCYNRLIVGMRYHDCRFFIYGAHFVFVLFFFEFFDSVDPTNYRRSSRQVGTRVPSSESECETDTPCFLYRLLPSSVSSVWATGRVGFESLRSPAGAPLRRWLAVSGLGCPKTQPTATAHTSDPHPD